MASQPAGTIEEDAAPEVTHSPRWLVDELLREQQQVLPVERFARWHEAEAEASPISLAAEPGQTRHYRDLIPVGLPRAGEQFAFEVDLDACSGCKACVTACHSLNDLEPSETWRAVGLLHGGSAQLPALQHVTTACHHCVDPACLKGCPVDAYVKDPTTGIVRHLDDQCIGCQYCTLMCPYDVPKYSHRLGIVRKCDMCRMRLAVGEAPACVQACPNSAIRIAIVNRQEAVESAEANAFLPGAPEPGCTLPTTIYKSSRPMPRNMLPADYYAAAPQHAHWPLILMLLLTQMSVGALVAGLAFFAAANVHHAAATLVAGLLGIAASTMHLGRPRYAFRAVIAWRRSWLSREIIAVGVYAVLTAAFAATVATGALALGRGLGLVAAAVGLFGVFCSSMIYAVTERPFWSLPRTATKFSLSGAVLGLPLALLAELLARDATNGVSSLDLLTAIVAVGTAKLAVDASTLLSLRSRANTPLRRTALLMTGELSRWTKHRFAWGAAGVVLPGLVYLVQSQSASAALDSASAASPQVVASIAAGLTAAFVGELCERYLFFAAVVAPKMPGAQSA